ncbi:MAG: hypothetical protein IJA03_04820 [Bacteroidaceae bacterium]|nr:hypothetical protein [Bacteroidaceae bacterium]MBQ4645175.1 hypothetical protein [Clostridia bacterium]
MKKTIYSLALSAFLLASCTQEESLNTGEEVKVYFTANLSNGIQSRAGTSTIAVDNMICAVYNQTADKILIRDTVKVENGKAEFAPSLLKNDIYNIVFWAYKAKSAEDKSSKCYDMNNLAAIKFNPTAECTNEDIEVYTFTLNNVNVTDINPKVTLKRPLAKINVASATGAWDSVEKLGKTPTSSELTLKRCFDTYNALNRTYSSSVEGGVEHNYKLSTLAKENILFTTGEGESEIKYFLLASGYTFGQNTVDCSIKVNDENGQELNSFSVPNVGTDENYRTNLYSENLLTANVKFTVNITEGYESSNNQNIP